MRRFGLLLIGSLFLSALGCDPSVDGGGSGGSGGAGGAGGSAPTGQMCGGIAGVQCADGQVCDVDIPNACGGADLSGVCKNKPQACDDIYQPVCGCDGTTYGNDCERLSNGVQLDHAGACEAGPNPQSCGGLQGVTCPDGQVCDVTFPDACDGADLGGVCKTKPQACDAIYDPECGCDGKTYGNDCERLIAEVQLDHKGECAAP